MVWLQEFLAELELESFLIKFSNDLRVSRPIHLDYICDKDLERIGLSADDSKRFLDAVDTKYRRRASKDTTDELTGAAAAAVTNKTPVRIEAQGLKCFDSNAVELSLYETLGTCARGLLRRAEWKPLSEKFPVAARVLHNDSLAVSGGSVNGDIVFELNRMSKLTHRNILRLYGVCLSVPTPILLSEYCEMGSVKTHLLAQPGAFGEVVVTVRMLLAYAIQTVHALQYLEQKGFVHGNVAACNVMLFESNMIKLGDYGLGKILQPRVEFVQKRGAWFAPESFESNTFSHSTDCWMFGVTLWEMFSAGADPWCSSTLSQVRLQLSAGCRLPRPAHCHEQIYDAMISCWSHEPAERSKFSTLLNMLNEVSFPVMKAYANSCKGELEIENGDDIIVMKGGADSDLWTGQNKRTGSVGQFSRLLLSPATNWPPAVNGTLGSDCSNVKSLINLHVEEDNGGSDATGRSDVAKSALMSGWETFESTTDLTKPQVQTVQPSADSSNFGATSAGFDLNDASISLANANAKVNKTVARRQEVRAGGGGVGYGFQVGNGSSFADVSDSERLLPPSSAASVTSLSEPCSPAHQNAARIRGPFLGPAAVENMSFDDNDDETVFYRSLPAIKTADRLNWAVSASCENLDSGGSTKRPGGNTLGASAITFPENLSKSSSDSHMYIDRDFAAAAAAAPPVPPRDYPKHVNNIQRGVALLPVHLRSSIHPVLQDGHQRSHTHYWLLPEKQKLGVPPPCPAAHASAQHSPYINMTDSQWQRGGNSSSKSQSNSGTAIDGSVLSSAANKALLADLSHTTSVAHVDNDSHASMSEVCEKIEQVQNLLGIESVCTDEILTALTGHQWSVEESVRYLKIEHLFRLGLAPRPFCRTLLEAHCWELEPAASALVDRCGHS